jgi:hypothetical protein
MAPPRLRPGKHPEPPADLHARRLPTRAVRNALTRIFQRGRAPLFFGRTVDNRFDAPSRQFGVLYAGNDPHCAFIETFGSAGGARFVTQDELRGRGLADVLPRRPLKLVNLSGSGLSRLSADARLTHGDHDVAQRWSLALYEHPEKPDGLWYRARHDDSRFAVALFDRARTLVEARVRYSDLGHARAAAMVSNLLDHYDLALAP